ncbi:hypothetical protein B7486_58010, partial [cyanobacterium TDX16]
GVGDGELPILSYEVRVSPGDGACTANAGSRCTVFGLSNGSPYRASVRAVNAIGPGEWSPWSEPVVPYGRPGTMPPPSVEAGSGSFAVTVEPGDPNGSPITRYDVRSSPVEGGSCTLTEPGTCTIDGLDPDVEVRHSVRAVNARGAGLWSEWSEPLRPSQCQGTGGPFPDVGHAHPFCAEIEWMLVEGITSGYDDGTFRPASVISRMAMAAQLHRVEGEPSFPLPDEPSFDDVPTGHPFFLPIEWARGAGITEGYSDGTFRPARPISRAAMAAMLHRLSGSPEVLVSTQSFSDVSPSHPFFEEVEWAADQGITNGFPDGTFQPAQPVTRQAMAAFLHRWSQLAL